MQTRRLGGTGLKLSAVGYGTWVTFAQQLDRAAADRVLGHALELGINWIDTADVYMKGAAEKLVGEAMAARRRSGFVLATKAFGQMGSCPNDRGLSRKHLIEACEASLGRLRTDYIDLYQAHRYDVETPLDEVLEAMGQLVRQGKVLYWGVSMWSAVQIVEAVLGARANRLPAPVSNQPLYNLFNRSLERDVMRVCEDYGLGIVCYSPLAQGVLTGKYSGGAVPVGSRAASESTAVWIKRYMTEAHFAKVDRLAEVAQRLDATPAQLALAWCLRLAPVTSVIVGASKVDQLTENAAAAALVLPPAVVEEIDAIFESAPRDQYTGERLGYGHEKSGW